VRNSSLVKWFCAENVTGLKFATEASDVLVISVFFQSEQGKGRFGQNEQRKLLERFDEMPSAKFAW
jgi:hypothetical protein